MSNSCGRMRTNYFRVTDADKLKEIIAKCQRTDCEEVLLFEEETEGETLYGFGCPAALQGYYDADAMEYDYDAFLDDLQTVIAPGDAAIIMEIGYEQLSYVSGMAIIVTREKTESMDFTQLVLKKAAEVVGNPDYHTRIEY